MKILCLNHVPYEGPGSIGEWAERSNVRISLLELYKNQSLPKLLDFDCLLIMGGPQSVLTISDFPYLKQERDFIAHCIKNNKKVLGMCLGAQLISESLNAACTLSPFSEVGYFPISLTNEGKNDPNLCGLPSEFLAGHWHSDMVGLPRGAKVLAKSAGCPRQIIRFAKNVYGFQCHLEFRAQDVKALAEKSQKILEKGKYIQSIDEIFAADFQQVNGYLNLFLDKFLLGKK